MDAAVEPRLVPLDLLTHDWSLGTPLAAVAWPATSEGAERLSRVVRKKRFDPPPTGRPQAPKPRRFSRRRRTEPRVTALDVTRNESRRTHRTESLARSRMRSSCLHQPRVLGPHRW